MIGQEVALIVDALLIDQQLVAIADGIACISTPAA